MCRRYLASLDNPDANRTTEQVTVVADITALYRAALRGAGVHTARQLDDFLADRPYLGALERGLFLDAFDGSGGTARTLDGNPVSDGLLSTISSSSTLERLLTVESRVIDMGRNIRHFTPHQRRAVLARDGGCRTAGCDAGPERCDIHHVHPWETGGTTDLTNAVAKCRHCHHDHHRRGWPDHLHPDGTYTITTDTGPTTHHPTTRWKRRTSAPYEHHRRHRRPNAHTTARQRPAPAPVATTAHPPPNPTTTTTSPRTRPPRLAPRPTLRMLLPRPPHPPQTSPQRPPPNLMIERIRQAELERGA